MTKTQVVNDTAWGEPGSVNRTRTAAGVREQWVYGLKRFMYFDNGRLVAIQD
ncbi:hypothetical protein [Ramlibacter sp.]|uniref:hypothetical protein n=1 Tax=Ramlibacter sp. TaxID=1917967 RepID=UPI003D11CE8D